MIKYVRNKDAVKAIMGKTASGQIVAKAPCVIHSPTRFADVGLANIGAENYIYGCFPVITNDNKYSVCNINALVEIDPFKITQTIIEGIDYNVFHFRPGDKIIKTTSIVQRDTLMFDVFNELFFKGKIPWYVGYEDLGKLFDTAKYYADSRVGDIYEVVELLASIVTRVKGDRKTMVRNTVTSKSQVEIDKIDYVPLQSIFYSVNTTLNKLAGAYFNDGVTSALVDQSSRVGKIESILRA